MMMAAEGGAEPTSDTVAGVVSGSGAAAGDGEAGALLVDWGASRASPLMFAKAATEKSSAT